MWRLDRLRRSIRSLIGFVEQLRDRGVDFRSLNEGIDTTTAAGRFFFHVMAALAQMERELIYPSPTATAPSYYASPYRNYYSPYGSASPFIDNAAPEGSGTNPYVSGVGTSGHAPLH